MPESVDKSPGAESMDKLAGAERKVESASLSSYVLGAPAEPIVLSVIGHQNAGKTLFIERLVEEARRHAWRVAVIKHDGHRDQLRSAGVAEAAQLASESQPRPVTGGPGVAGVAEDWQKPDSDTVRYTRAGADVTLVVGGGQSLLWQRADVAADEPAAPLALVRNVREAAAESGIELQLILVEGYKRGSLPKLAILADNDDGQWLVAERIEGIVGVVTGADNRNLAPLNSPVYDRTDTHRLFTRLGDLVNGT